MRLLNLFKEDFKLDKLLERAIKDPSSRINFYKRLINEKLIVIVNKKFDADVDRNSVLNITTLQDGRVPVFTSKERIFDNGIIKRYVDLVEINAKKLFEITKGATLILNPYSKYNKKIVPEEIEQILDGRIFLADNPTEIMVNRNSKPVVGEPTEYPTEIIDALKNLFSQRHDVQCAYFGWAYLYDSNDKPHYIFGIKTNGNIDQIICDAGDIVRGFLSKDDFVDFINMNSKGEIIDYLKSTEPFYTKESIVIDTKLFI